MLEVEVAAAQRARAALQRAAQRQRRLLGPVQAVHVQHVVVRLHGKQAPGLRQCVPQVRLLAGTAEAPRGGGNAVRDVCSSTRVQAWASALGGCACLSSEHRRFWAQAGASHTVYFSTGQ